MRAHANYVVKVYRFRVHTLYAAVNYLDRFLSRIAIERTALQLTGVTCLMLAAKYEEINPPCVEEFVYITDSTCVSPQLPHNTLHLVC